MTDYVGRWGGSIVIVIVILIGVPIPSNATVPYSLIATNATNQSGAAQGTGHRDEKNRPALDSIKAQMWLVWREAKDYVTYGLPQLVEDNKTAISWSVLLLVGLTTIVLGVNRRAKKKGTAFVRNEAAGETTDDIAPPVSAGRHDPDRLGPDH